MQMYGKRRVVLESKPRHFRYPDPTLYTVTVCGTPEGETGGSYLPLGYWYQDSKLRFYTNLVSELFGKVDRTGLGGFRTKAELRKFVAAEYRKMGGTI